MHYHSIRETITCNKLFSLKYFIMISRMYITNYPQSILYVYILSYFPIHNNKNAIFLVSILTLLKGLPSCKLPVFKTMLILILFSFYLNYFVKSLKVFESHVPDSEIPNKPIGLRYIKARFI